MSQSRLGCGRRKMTPLEAWAYSMNQATCHQTYPRLHIPIQPSINLPTTHTESLLNNATWRSDFIDVCIGKIETYLD